MKKIIAGIFMLSCICGQAQSEEQHFFSHLIISPLVKALKANGEVSSDITDAIMGRTTQGVIGHINIKKSLVQEDVLIISYQEVPNTHLTLFRENGIIVRMVRNQNGVETDFSRPSLPAANLTSEIAELTSARLREVYLAEDFNFNFTDSEKTIAVEVLAVQVIDNENHVVVRIDDAENSGTRLIQYRDDSLFGESRDFLDSSGTPQMYFAVHLRLGNDSILLDSYVNFGNGDSNYCEYYSSGFLKNMVVMTQGKWGKQKVWTREGILSGEYDYPPGMPPPPKITSPFVPTWLTYIPNMRQFRLVDQNFWDESTQSPYYKVEFCLSTNNESILELYFSTEPQLLEKQFDTLLAKKLYVITPEAEIDFSGMKDVRQYQASNGYYGIIWLSQSMIAILEGEGLEAISTLARETDRIYNMYLQSK